MKATVVCVSRTSGAGGELIGRMVADRLGYHYVDDEVVKVAAEKAGVDPSVVAAAEQRRGLLNRILDALAAVPPQDPYVLMPLAGGIAYLGQSPIETAPPSEDLRELIAEAIREIAARGHIVIVAHAASLALAGTPGILRVFVTASEETRIHRLKLLQREDAASAIRESDRARRDYLQRFHGIKEELPTHYDLVVNTDVLRPEQAANLIVSAVQS